ncbi:sensor histidine kinase [Fibrella forsythiae]|nr:PAS domain-containing sensor histidine kinase [Fibrella forsythiae]
MPSTLEDLRNTGATDLLKQLEQRVEQLTAQLAQRTAQVEALQLAGWGQPTALLAHIVEHTALAIGIVRKPNWVIELANPAMCLLWGQTEAQVLGQPLLSLLPQASQDLEQALREVLQTGKPLQRSEYALPVRLGDTMAIRYLDLRYDPLPSNDGVLQRISLTAVDVTTRVQTRHQAEKLLTEKRELHQLESNFVTLASHEFRTPMGTILSSASLIGRYNGADDADKRERHVQQIKTAVNALNELITDFLSLGKLDKLGQMQPLVLSLFCGETMAQTQAIAKADQRFIYRHLGGDPAITTDGNLLKKILVNLLVNASKYSSEGKVIELTTRTTDALLLIQVRDEGIGISDVDKENLFINFFRGRSAVHVQGTGLGLYIVKRYVDLLGGTITFTSQPGQGTIFTVELPL